MTAPLTRPGHGSVNTARPMLEFLKDDALRCNCPVFSELVCMGGNAMTVTAAEYQRADRFSELVCMGGNAMTVTAAEYQRADRWFL